MSSFKEFMDEIENSHTQEIPTTDLTIPAIKTALALATVGFLKPFSFSNDEKEKFSEEVSSLIQDKSFLAELSDEIAVPLEGESENEFVSRSTNALRRILYEKFNIKNE